MTIPAAATKVHLDSGADDPKQARPELADLVDKFNTLRSHLLTSTITSGTSVLGIGTGLQSSGGNLIVNFGSGIGQAVQLEDVGGSAGLPAIDGSQLTGISAGALTDTFTSTEQTITSAGPLTIAHGLSSAPDPDDCGGYLVCKTTQHGYAVSDKLAIYFGPIAVPGDTNTGVSVVPDGTNLNIQFGSAASVFYAMNKTTGVLSALTNSSWRIVFKARV